MLGTYAIRCTSCDTHGLDVIKVSDTAFARYITPEYLDLLNNWEFRNLRVFEESGEHYYEEYYCLKCALFSRAEYDAIGRGPSLGQYSTIKSCPCGKTGHIFLLDHHWCTACAEKAKPFADKEYDYHENKLTLYRIGKSLRMGSNPSSYPLSFLKMGIIQKIRATTTLAELEELLKLPLLGEYMKMRDSISTSGELREFLADLMVDVSKGGDVERLRNITKAAAQVNESFYSEIKIAKTLLEAGKEVAELGNLPLNKSKPVKRTARG